MNLFRFSLTATVLTGSLVAQTVCPSATPATLLGPIDVDAVTGVGLNYGVEFAGGEFFVTGAAASTTGPFDVFVLDANGNLLRSFPQPAASQPSALGLLDGATDSVSLFFGNENGIFAFDRNGAPRTRIFAANGAQFPTFPITGPALATLGTYRALAYDPNGNSGNGSFFAGDLGDDILEIDLAGNVLRTIANGGQWSVTGLAFVDGLTFNARALWVNSSTTGDLAAIDLATGLEADVSMPLGIANGGGLCRGSDADLVSLDQGAPDTLTGTEIPAYLTSPLRMLTGVDGVLTPTASTATTLNSSLQWDLDAPPGTPYAYLWNVAPQSSLCGTFFQFLQRPDQLAFGGLKEWESITDFTIPTSIIYLLEPASAGSPVSAPTLSLMGQTGALGNVPDGLMRLQAVYADLNAPNLLNPVRVSPPAYLTLDSTPRNGVTVATEGVNSFNADTTRGFFQISSISPDPMKAITSVTLDFTVNLSVMEFDTDQIGMADIFESGNSSVVGCVGTYRNASDILTGLDFSGLNTMPATPCNAGALSGFFGSNPTLSDSWQTLRFEFDQGTFFNGAMFEFDADTDGGGVDGASMAGLVVTVTFADGSMASGTLASVGGNRAEVTL